MKSNLTIIIPARNEEQIIAKTIDAIEKTVKIPHDIVIIDGCSTDNTKAIALRTKGNIRIINQKNNKSGFADALASGIQNTNCEFVVFVMADLCDNPCTINKMYKKINQGWDVVCGSRYMKGAKKIGGPKIQGLFSYIVCKSLHLLTGIPTKDVSNAFKMYRRSILEKIVFDRKGGMEVSMEIALQAYFKGARMIDIPTTWVGRSVGVSKFKIIERGNKYFKIYLWALKNAFHLI